MEEIKFTFNEVGNFSQENFIGTFKMKTKLSYRETLRQDQIRRDLLGAKPEFASPEAISIADALAFLGVYLTETPSWWKEKDGGLDVVDDNIVPKVYSIAASKLKDFFEERNKKAEEAKAALAK